MAKKNWLRGTSGNRIYALDDAENNLLQVLLTEFELCRSDPGFSLKVTFDGNTPTIRRREAKARLQRRMPGYPAKVAGIQNKIDDLLLRRRESYHHEDPDFVFRYASGGTLPVLQVRGVDYYCLFYRDAFPIGWNIANGACDSLLELKNPVRAIAREFREELIILDLDHDPCYDHVPSWPTPELPEMPEFTEARRQASRFLADELQIHRDFEKAPLEVHWDPPGHDRVDIALGDEAPVTIKGIYVNVNARDFGIEVDRVATMKIEPNWVLLDGEINDNRWLNRPIGLFEVGRAQELVRSGAIEFFPDKLFHSARLRISFPSVDQSIQRVIEDEFFGYLIARGLRTEVDLAKWKAETQALDLCPVTRQIIQRHIAARKISIFISYGREDRSFAERLDADLRARDLETWWDCRHLRPRGSFDREIEAALDHSTHVVLIASESPEVGEWTRIEVQSACDSNKGRIVVLRHTPESCNILKTANRWRRIDFSRDYDRALNELVAAILLK